MYSLFPDNYKVFSGGSPSWYMVLQIDRLKRLGLVRLENRRSRSDLIKTYKILNENYCINRELFFDIDVMGLRGMTECCLKEGSDYSVDCQGNLSLHTPV